MSRQTRECSVEELWPELRKGVTQFISSNDKPLICCETKITRGLFERISYGLPSAIYSAEVVTQSHFIHADLGNYVGDGIVSVKLVDIESIEEKYQAENYYHVIVHHGKDTASCYFTIGQIAQKFANILRQAVEQAKAASISLSARSPLYIEGDYIVGNNPIKVTLGNGNIFSGDIIVGQSIKDSFDKAASADVNNELKDLLKKLSVAVNQMCGTLPEDKAKQVAKALDRLIDEAINEKPQREWWQVSVDGLTKAAENIGKVGKPVLDILARLVPVLVSISR